MFSLDSRTPTTDRLGRTLAKLRRLAAKAERRPGALLGKYAADPVGYVREVLGKELTPDQAAIARSLLKPPHRTLVPSAHNTGKSFLAACVVSWWYDTFDPGIALTTAPNQVQVEEILWGELRHLRERLGGFPTESAPRLWSSPKHWAKGYTARDATRFQGRHGRRVLIGFDEALGVEPPFWDAAETMLGGDAYAWLCIYNPTDPSSHVRLKEESGQWHVHRLSAYAHPNLEAERRGRPAPFPAAVRLERFEEQMRAWSEPVPPGEETPNDVEIGWRLLPDGTRTPGRWYRPGPEAESRLLGRWPSQSMYSVWSLRAWDAAANSAGDDAGALEIGCDVARYGDDYTEIHVRKGGASLEHFAVNGWNTRQTAEKCKLLAWEWGRRHGLDPKRVPVKIDDAGVGGGVTDQADDFNFVPYLGIWAALDEERYPNTRSELWFALAEAALEGRVGFGRLSAETRAKLKEQFMAPRYKLDERGRRCVERKDDTKERIKRSPDGADAVMLAYAALRDTPDRVAGRIVVPH